MRTSRIDSESRLIRADAAAIYNAYINPADLSPADHAAGFAATLANLATFVEGRSA